MTNEELVERAFALRDEHPEWSHAMIFAAAFWGEDSLEFELASVRCEISTRAREIYGNSIAAAMASIAAKQALERELRERLGGES